MNQVVTTGTWRARDGEEDAFQTRRRDWTPWEFERACRALTRQGFRVNKAATAPQEPRPAAATG